jgi:hypothetical protein
MPAPTAKQLAITLALLSSAANLSCYIIPSFWRNSPVKAYFPVLLLKWEPGATLPMHKHPEIEQTYVIEGSFYDHDGICRAGEFVWRPGLYGPLPGFCFLHRVIHKASFRWP